MHEMDQQLLHYLNQAKADYKELAQLLLFYEKLFSLLGEFKAHVNLSHLGAGAINDAMILQRLSEGTPAVAFDDLTIETDSFWIQYQQLAGFLTQHLLVQDADAAEGSPSVLRERARKIFESRNPIIVSEPAGNVAAIAAGFALMPYLQMACEEVMPRIVQSLWQRGYCPVCGGKPAFAALAKDSGARSLLCSRCSGIWGYGRTGCPFCEETAVQTYYPSDDRIYRLYVCDSCRCYLKTIDLREIDRDACLPVENIVTVSLDIAAREKGYRHY